MYFSNVTFSDRYASDRAVSEREVDIRTRTVRGNLVHQLGASLHVAWPNWTQNTASDYSALYTNQRKTPIMKRLIAIVLSTIVLASCGSTGLQDASAPPIQQISNADTVRSVVLAEHDFDIPLSNADIDIAADAACSTLADGMGFYELAIIMAAEFDTAYEQNLAAYMVGALVGAYCPQYGEL